MLYVTLYLKTHLLVLQFQKGVVIVQKREELIVSPLCSFRAHYHNDVSENHITNNIAKFFQRNTYLNLHLRHRR